jgi:hypothetical protein
MDDREPQSVADAIRDAFAADALFERLPVKNREDRAPIDEAKRMLIFRRDRGMCWICGTYAEDPVLDHLRPRSNWPADQMDLADRSDNLHVACWTCNEERSNVSYLAIPSVAPVVYRCFKCEDETPWLPAAGRGVRVYCAKCGFSESGNEATFA